MQCWGFLPAGEVRTASALLERRGGLGDAFALVGRGRYRALQGDLSGGRSDMAAGRALIREFGAEYYVAGSGQENGALELEAGDPVAAETPLREAYEMYHEMGVDAATAACFLARALFEQGRFDESDRFARIGEEGVAADDVLSQADWRYMRARLFANKGDLAAAEALAREAVALTEPTDYLEERAQSLLALAEVLELRGQTAEAQDALERAGAAYERKESVLGVERVRARLRELVRKPLAERK